MIRAAPAISAIIIAAKPTGPAPTTATSSPGLIATVLHPDLIAGWQDVGEEQHLLIAHVLRDDMHRGLGKRPARVLGPQTVDQMAEDPTDPARPLAVGRHASLARTAASARRDRRHEHAVALLKDGHSRSGSSTVPTASEVIVVEDLLEDPAIGVRSSSALAPMSAGSRRQPA
jgi:hypothetical protein